MIRPGRQSAERPRAPIGPRKGRPLCLGLLTAALGAGSLLFAAAPQASAPRAPLVSLAEIKGTSGSSVLMPLSLAADPKRPLRSLTVDIEFVSKSLTFQKISRGIAAEVANADIQARIVKEQDDANGLKHVTLRVTASLPDPPPASGLPDGLLAYLLFQIAPEAQSFTIKLTPVAVSGNDLSSPPQRVENIASQPGAVVIESLREMYDRLAPPLACFFFSH
ncbi:MAG TPA: hypothetical protein VNN17_05695 [Terriglobia bacterium]|nr:hypothetical protein [Terriglobia bacterium]